MNCDISFQSRAAGSAILPENIAFPCHFHHYRLAQQQRSARKRDTRYNRSEMKKKICGKETSEVRLKLNSSLYRNDRSITFPVLLDNSLVQSINKQGMHVPVDEHLHFSALSSTNVRQMFKGGLSSSYTLEQSPMDNTVSHTALPDNSKSLPTFSPQQKPACSSSNSVPIKRNFQRHK